MDNSENPTLDFGVDKARLRPLHGLRPYNSRTVSAFNEAGLTSEERLFFNLSRKTTLHSSMFMAGRTITTRGKPVDLAYVIVEGQAIANDGQRDYPIGPGSVLGLAEGMARMSHMLTVTADSLVQTVNIKMDSAIRELQLMNKGLRGISRCTIMRIMQLDETPEALK